MSTAKTERSRLGDLLVEMRLVDEVIMRSVMSEQRISGQRLIRILSERRVIDEEQVTRAVAAELGIEAVSVSGLRINEQVLELVPAAIARAHGVLPIAVKRTNQADVVYLVTADPLDGAAIAEVQRITGRQVRVLMAKATELDQVVQHHYGPPSWERPPSMVGRAPTERGERGGQRSGPSGSGPAARADNFAELGLADPGLPPPRTSNPPPPRNPDAVETSESTPVMPVDLDGRDASTRLDDSFGGISDGADATPTPAREDEWDRSVRDWEATPFSDPNGPGDDGYLDRSESLADVLAGSLGDRAGTLRPDEPGSGDEDPVTALAPLDQLDWGAQAGTLGSALTISTAPTAEMAGDDPARTPDVSRRLLAAALEIPVNWEDDSHPFQGPGLSDVRVGLEKTAIIPASDLDALEFSPPPLGELPPGARALAGVGDIPTSAEAVEARSGPPTEDDEAEDADIEEVVLDPLADEEGVTPDVDDTQTVRPGPATDSMNMPVIEPSRLASLMDDADLTGGDTGADEVPFADPAPVVGDPSAVPPPPILAAERETVDLPHEGRVPPPPMIAHTEDLLPPQEGTSPPSEDRGSGHPRPSAATRHSTALVASLRSGASLSSPQRAELLLALGRVLLDKGIITEAELLKALLD